jgi:hypothetical protein
MTAPAIARAAPAPVIAAAPAPLIVCAGHGATS